MSAGAYRETQTHCCREDPCGLPFPRAAGHSCFCTSHCTLQYLSPRAECSRPLAPGISPPSPFTGAAVQACGCLGRVTARATSPTPMCAAPPFTVFGTPPPPHPPPRGAPISLWGPCITAVHEDQNVQKAEVQTDAAVRRPSPGNGQRRACRCHNNGREECALAARPRETPLTNGQSTPRTTHTPHA